MRPFSSQKKDSNQIKQPNTNASSSHISRNQDSEQNDTHEEQDKKSQNVEGINILVENCDEDVVQPPPLYQTAQVDKTKFQWLPCNFFLKQQIHDRTIVWSMNQSITFGNPKTDAPNPIINMKIWMDRPFIYDQQLGWNWHKSWILPTICVKLEIIDPNSDEIFQPPNNTFAKVYAVKAYTKDIQNFHLIDIGLKGNSKISLEQNGTAQFSALKFSSTSYNNDGNKFNLVVAIIIDDNTTIHPKIVDAKISPPVFVDSRKSARETQTVKDTKINSFFELFNPEIMEKSLVKRKKKDAESIQEEITNDITGLTNYFTAPNIRNKDSDEKMIIKDIMENFQEKAGKPEKSQKSEQIVNKFNPSAHLSICIISENENNIFMNKKINDLIGQADNKYINILFQLGETSQNFVQLTDPKIIKDTYKKYYHQVLQGRNMGNSSTKCREKQIEPLPSRTTSEQIEMGEFENSRKKICLGSTKESDNSVLDVSKKNDQQSEQKNNNSSKDSQSTMNITQNQNSLMNNPFFAQNFMQNQQNFPQQFNMMNFLIHQQQQQQLLMQQQAQLLQRQQQLINQKLLDEQEKGKIAKQEEN